MSAESATTKLFVGNLSWKIKSEELRTFFEKFGTVTDAAVVKDRETDRSRGFGFVSFDSVDSAAAAQKEMDNLCVDGRNIRVNFATLRDQKPRAFSSEGSSGERSYGRHY